MEKMASDDHKWDPRGVFPTNPDIVDISGRTYFNSEDFHFFILWTPHFWISRSPDLQISGYPSPQISKLLDFQVPRFPDAAGAAGDGQTLRSQPDASPNAPRDQVHRKEPLL